MTRKICIFKIFLLYLHPNFGDSIPRFRIRVFNPSQIIRKTINLILWK